MKPDDLLDAIGEIEDSYLDTAYEKKPRRTIKWIGIGSLAACLLFLFMPFGVLHRLNSNDTVEVDYSSKDYTRFFVYYVDGETLSSFTYEIHGGYEEMFFAWKNQNGIGEEVLLKKLELNVFSTDDSSSDDHLQSGEFLRITVSSSFEAYLKEDTRELLLEALKKTVASYTGEKIDGLELILDE